MVIGLYFSACKNLEMRFVIKDELKLSNDIDIVEILPLDLKVIKKISWFGPS